MFKLIMTLSVLILIAGCGDRAYETVQLPSGVQINLESIENVPVSDERYYVAFSYVTATNIHDEIAIEEEAWELWQYRFGAIAEQKGAESAVLIAHNEPKPAFGFFSRYHYGTAFVKMEGQWLKVNVPNK